MIVIKQTKHGLIKGQKFDELVIDGDLAVLKTKRRIAFLPARLITSELIRDKRQAA